VIVHNRHAAESLDGVRFDFGDGRCDSGIVRRSKRAGKELAGDRRWWCDWHVDTGLGGKPSETQVRVGISPEVQRVIKMADSCRKDLPDVNIVAIKFQVAAALDAANLKESKDLSEPVRDSVTALPLQQVVKLANKAELPAKIGDSGLVSQIKEDTGWRCTLDN
jgi:hypothetical protein